MFRKQGIIALLGVGVVAAWPMASEAITCPAGYQHVTTPSGHTCVRVSTGSVLLEALTDYHPGKVTLTVLPQGRTGPKRGGDDDEASTTSTMSTTEPPVEALLVCRTEKSAGLVKIPASIPKFFNTTSTTVARSDHPGLFMGEYPGIRFKTTLSANPTPAQLLMLTRFCPGCANEKGKPVNYVSLNIRLTLAFETGAMFDLNAKGGNCTVNFGDLRVGLTGEFNRVSYGGGCAPPLGNESPYKEPPPTRHGEPKAKSRHQ